MPHKIIFFLASVFSGFILNAQNNTVAAGGDAAGSSGSVSFSVGQIDYTNVSTANGSISQGVQQPYEILIVSAEEIKGLALSLKVFPNPTSNIITLSADNVSEEMNYQVFDVQGKVIFNGIINNAETLFDFTELAQGSYLLKVSKNHREIQVFKIIKNH